MTSRARVATRHLVASATLNCILATGCSLPPKRVVLRRIGGQVQPTSAASPSAIQVSTSALRAWQRLDFAEAQRLAGIAVSLDPHDTFLRILHVDALSAAGNEEEAIQAKELMDRQLGTPATQSLRYRGITDCLFHAPAEPTRIASLLASHRSDLARNHLLDLANNSSLTFEAADVWRLAGGAWPDRLKKYEPHPNRRTKAIRRIQDRAIAAFKENRPNAITRQRVRAAYCIAPHDPRNWLLLAHYFGRENVSVLANYWRNRAKRLLISTRDQQTKKILLLGRSRSSCHLGRLCDPDESPVPGSSSQ